MSNQASLDRETARAQKEAARLQHIGAVGLLLDGRRDFAGVVVDGVKIRPPTQAWGETLVVITATDADGEPLVCFTTADSFVGALAKAFGRLTSGEVDWKIDGYRT